MNKLLAYSLWILLSLSSVSAIWCHDCEKKSAKEKCPKDKCWAGEGESCYTQNLYIGTRLYFVRFGCFKDCKYIYTPASFLWYSFTCCSENYCNKSTGVEF